MSEQGGPGVPRSGRSQGRAARAAHEPALQRHGAAVSPAVYRRRRVVVLGGAALLVLLVVLLLGFVRPGFAGSDGAGAASPAVTVTPSPEAPATPTFDPVARPDDATAFELALPSEVGRFVLVDEGETAELDDASPNEAFVLSYADGEGADAATVDVVAGQWLDEKSATSAYDALLDGLGAPDEEGDVTVGDATTGAYVRVDDGATSTVLWRNGTAVVRATGPAEDVQRFYTQFPL